MAKTFTPLFGKRIRVTKLDSCGNPVDDDTGCGYIVTGGFISVSLSSEIESGQEIITRKADGSLCVNERTSDAFKRFNVEIEFCEVFPALWSIMTNADPYETADGETNGFTIGEGNIDAAYAFELWTGLTGQACEEGVEEASGYLLLPFVNAGTLGDLEINGENAITFTATGGFTKGGNNWGVGPYDVYDDGPLPTPLDPSDHLLMLQTNTVPPEETDGCVAIGDGSDSTL